jgi:hypothetical protein
VKVSKLLGSTVENVPTTVLGGSLLDSVLLLSRMSVGG